MDFFSKYAWVVQLKGKRGISVVNAFQKIVSDGCKPIEIGVHQGGQFYNKLFKRFLKRVGGMCKVSSKNIEL